MSKFSVIHFRHDVHIQKGLVSRVNKNGNPPDVRWRQTEILVDFDDRVVTLKDPRWDKDYYVPMENVKQLEKTKGDAVADKLAKARAAKGK